MTKVTRESKGEKPANSFRYPKNSGLSQEMQRIMARQAEAEREKRCVIIASEGELQAALNLKKASDILMDSKYGFALRQLATLSGVSQDQSNTVVFYPLEDLNQGIIAGGLAAMVPKLVQNNF